MYVFNINIKEMSSFPFNIYIYIYIYIYNTLYITCISLLWKSETAC